MKAMVLNSLGNLDSNSNPLTLSQIAPPKPGRKEILLKLSACGVCHTEIDEIEGRTPPPRLPVIPGHQVVGQVEALGVEATRYKTGDRLGVGWIFSSCGKCKFCLEGNENLCPDFMATGRDVDGGYAEYMTVHEDFAYAIPEIFSDSEAAPLLCAGAIGFRSVRLSNLENGENLGLTGFGSSGHLVLKMVQHHFPRSKVFVFARSEKEREFAKNLGAVWAGSTEDPSPELLDSIIDTTPVWKAVVSAMKNLRPGGRLVVNAIRKEEGDKNSLLQIDYATHLWMEKEIKSVANVSRADVSGFLKLASEIPIKPEVEEFPLQDANKALMEMKRASIRGAKVLRMA